MPRVCRFSGCPFVAMNVRQRSRSGRPAATTKRSAKELTMAKYVYVYTGGQMAETPEAQEQAMQAWGAWFGTLGGAVTDVGNPFGTSATVKPDGVAGSGASN